MVNVDELGAFRHANAGLAGGQGFENFLVHDIVAVERTARPSIFLLLA